MVSNVRDYLELYNKFEDLYDKEKMAELQIRDIQEEIQRIENCQDRVDYNNPNVIIENMENYINESIQKKKTDIQNKIDDKMEELTNPSERIVQNFNKAVKWLSRKKVDKYLRSIEIDFEKEVDIEKAEKAVGFNIATTLNTIFSMIFRFDFLRFLHKAIRIILAIIFWAIFLIPKVVSVVYDRFEIIYDNNYAHLSGPEYELIRGGFVKNFVEACVISVIIVIFLIVIINLIAYLMSKYAAKRFLFHNQVICLSFIDPDGLEKKMYDYQVDKYMKDIVTVWQAEMQEVKRNGLIVENGEESLITLIKNDLRGTYSALERKANNCKTRISDIQRKSREWYAERKGITLELKDKEKDVNSFIVDSNHNNAILSPYVAAGYSQYCTEGVKKLIDFKHDYKPMLIRYNTDTVKNGDRFRKNVAMLIELFMTGFYRENYHGHINMTLVALEELYFPPNRTQGLMKVVKSTKGVQQLFDELQTIKNKIEDIGDGRISAINPVRLNKRENPIKYNIVYFVGCDLLKETQEIINLFIGGENFGFLPIVFMEKSISENKNALGGFAKVIEKMESDCQIYEFEELVAEFEYELMVSDQKKILDEKFCVNKIMSMREFIEAAESEEGLTINDDLYLDTDQLEEEIYQAVIDKDYVKLFTLNGVIPEFIAKDKVIDFTN